VFETTFADQYCIGCSQEPFLAKSSIQESKTSVEGSSSDQGFGVLSQVYKGNAATTQLPHKSLTKGGSAEPNL
jgi:hypothetical protein